MIKISVIIPCRNEEKYIRDFIESVVKNDYPKDLLEVFVIDGRSDDSTMSILENIIKNYNFIKILINEKKTVPYALNLGLEKSTGKYIIRLDVHSKIPENYFKELITSALELDADNTGTICITDVQNKNPKSNAIKKVLSNKYGVGNSYFRVGVDKIMEVDTVPFGCYKREVFKKVGVFNNHLIRNQDIELNKRIKKSGGKIILLSNPYSIYFARENFSSLARNNISTGYWNILTIFITKYFKSVSMRHLTPLIFILSLFLPILLMFSQSFFGIITGVSLLSYLSLISIISFKLNDKTTSYIYIFTAFIVLHISYGFGSLVGLFRLDYLFKKNEINYL
jgi:glycosyltransferase involved in cell wall biosynthesis